jgi:hypothetical protein
MSTDALIHTNILTIAKFMNFMVEQRLFLIWSRHRNMALTQTKSELDESPTAR